MLILQLQWRALTLTLNALVTFSSRTSTHTGTCRLAGWLAGWLAGSFGEMVLWDDAGKHPVQIAPGLGGA